MKPAEARIVLDMLLAGWPHTDMPAETARLWLNVLADLDYQVASVAADTIVKNDPYFPSVSRLRAAVSATDRTRTFQWTPSPTCPVCAGSSIVSDDDGRWWLCRCSALERRPQPVNERTKPPQALLDMARRALRRDQP